MIGKMLLPRKLIRLGKYGVVLFATVSLIAIALSVFGFNLKWSSVMSGTSQHAHSLSYAVTVNNHDDREAVNSLLMNKIREAANVANGQMKTSTNLTSVGYNIQPEPNYNVHVFYYPWYGNPEKDGSYYHWNHDYLSHWNPVEDKKWPKGRHNPPDDIGSNFYPALGPYSSADKEVIENHMQQIKSSGAGMYKVKKNP